MSVFEGLGRNEEEWVGLLFLKKKIINGLFWNTFLFMEKLHR